MTTQGWHFAMHSSAIVPLQEKLKRFLKCWSQGRAYPELGVVGVADQSLPPVDTRVQFSAVHLLPLLQGFVQSLNEIVHHSSVGGIANEKNLWRKHVCCQVVC